MRNRKEKSIGLRLLLSLSSFLLLGCIIYILVAGINLYSGLLITASILGLGIPSTISGDGFLDVFVVFFESFLDGIMELLGGIIDAISSIFS